MFSNNNPKFKNFGVLYPPHQVVSQSFSLISLSHLSLPLSHRYHSSATAIEPRRPPPPRPSHLPACAPTPPRAVSYRPPPRVAAHAARPRATGSHRPTPWDAPCVARPRPPPPSPHPRASTTRATTASMPPHLSLISLQCASTVRAPPLPTHPLGSPLPHRWPYPPSVATVEERRRQGRRKEEKRRREEEKKERRRKVSA